MSEEPPDCKTLSAYTKHFLQWFVLSELQKPSSLEEYHGLKVRFYDWFRRTSIKDIRAYALYLIDQVRRDEDGLCYFKSGTVSQALSQPPRSKPVLSVIDNPDYVPPKQWHELPKKIRELLL